MPTIIFLVLVFCFLSLRLQEPPPSVFLLDKLSEMNQLKTFNVVKMYSRHFVSDTNSICQWLNKYILSGSFGDFYDVLSFIFDPGLMLTM